MKLLRFTKQGGKNRGRVSYHLFYRPETARRLGIKYEENWRDIVLKGNYAQLDDAWIGMVTGVNSMRNKPYRTIRFAQGTYLNTRGFRATSQLRASRNNVSGKKTQYTDPDRPLTTRDISAIAYWFKNDFDYVGAYGRASHQGSKRPQNTDTAAYHKKARAFFRRAHIQRGIFKILSAEMKNTKMTAEYLAEALMEVIDDKDCPHSTKVRAIGEGASWLGMKKQTPDQAGVLTGVLISGAKMGDLEDARRKQLDAGSKGGDGSGAGKSSREVVPGHGSVREGDFTEHTPPEKP